VHGFRCYDNIARMRNVSECLYSLYAWLQMSNLRVGDRLHAKNVIDFIVKKGKVRYGAILHRSLHRLGVPFICLEPVRDWTTKVCCRMS